MVSVNPGANLTLSSAATVYNLAGNGGTVNLGANQLTLNGTSANNFYGQILGTGLILKQNTGTQTLSGPVLTTGGITVDNGTLAFFNNGTTQYRFELCGSIDPVVPALPACVGDGVTLPVPESVCVAVEVPERVAVKFQQQLVERLTQPEPRPSGVRTVPVPRGPP